MKDITVFPAQATVVQNVRLYRYIRTLCLTIPVRSIRFTNESLNGTQKKLQKWWKDGNPSTYEVNSGLWTACKESRYIMEHAFRHCIWPGLRRNPDDPPEAMKDDIMISFHATTNTEKRCYSIRPRHDLFVFQLERMPFLNYFNYYRGVSFFGPHELKSHHVGLEFDPAWADTNRQYHRDPILRDGGYFITQLAGLAQRCDNLWVIDYNLTRRSDASRQEDPIERKLMTFQAGNRRFVEVKYDKEDVHTWREWEEIRKDRSDCWRPASLEDLTRLSQHWIHWPASSIYPWKKIRLLGWD